MSSFSGHDLFSSGPHEFAAGALSLRHVLHESPGALGVQLSNHGRHGRGITQTGELLGDDAAQVQSQINAIEALLDGQAHELADEHGQSWPDTVMLSIEVIKQQRIAARWRATYRIQYLQLTP